MSRTTPATDAAVAVATVPATDATFVTARATGAQAGTAAALAQRLAAVTLVGLDIDGCLTDGLLYWAGPEIGWTQRYAVRDGEAILRLRRGGFAVVPISRNKTACARARMEHLGLPTDWLGVGDKAVALAEVCARHQVSPEKMAYLGDGPEDVVVLRQVALACAPPEAHPQALAAAHYVTRALGGRGAAEEVADLLLSR